MDDEKCWECATPGAKPYDYGHHSAYFCNQNCRLKWHYKMTVPLLDKNGQLLLTKPVFNNQSTTTTTTKTTPPLTLGDTFQLEDATRGIACELPLFDYKVMVTSPAATRCALALVQGDTLFGYPELRVPRLETHLWMADDCEYMRDFDFFIEFCDTEGELDEQVLLHTVEGIPIYTTNVELTQLLLSLQEKGTVNRELVEPSTLAAFRDAWERKRLDLMGRSGPNGGWVYHDEQLLLCHLMIFGTSEIFAAQNVRQRSKTLLEHVNDLLNNYLIKGLYVKLHVNSYQRYVQRKLSILSPQRSLSNKRDQGMVHFSAPPIGDPVWPFFVRLYRDGQENAYYAKQLLKPEHISFVARSDDTGALIGYVTCTLSTTDKIFYGTFSRGWWWKRHPLLKNYTDATGGHYRTLTIDGLHVDPAWRGGATSSLATLLIFLVMHFAESSASETGALRVACFSLARTTAVIMRQFGATHLNAKQALGWMKQRQQENRGVRSDLIDFVTDYVNRPPLDNKNSVSMSYIPANQTESEQLDALSISMKENKRRFKEPLQTLRDLTDDNTMDTFLYIGPENKVFHTTLASYRERLSQHGSATTEGGMAEKRRTSDELAPENASHKRVKTGGAFSMSLDSLGKFDLS
jgi:hypothetical protein